MLSYKHHRNPARINTAYLFKLYWNKHHRNPARIHSTYFCAYTNITEIPQEFTQLSLVNCGNTNITEIPRELTQLTYLHCNHTKITEIPRELTQLTSLGCYDCPNLVKIPLRFKERHVNDDNFLRVPTKSRIIFLQYKKGYLESVRFNMEIKFNEVYWAPGGQGALELFEKYTNEK